VRTTISTLTLSVLLSVFSVSPLYSQDAEGKACSVINKHWDRLACYDKIFRSENTVIQQTITKQNSPETKPEELKLNWKPFIERSKIDDSKSVFFTTISIGSFSTKYNKNQKVKFTLRCLENRTSAYFNFGSEYMSDVSGYGEITLRKDKAKATTKSFSVSTDNSALGLWEGSLAIPFIKSLKGGESLLIQFTPVNDNRQIVIFDISGIEDVIPTLANSCNWN